MGKATVNMTPEQEEILDSGLRMLAHMIAETHLRRIASKKRSEASTSPGEANKCSQKTNPGKLAGENQTEGHDE